MSTSSSAPNRPERLKTHTWASLWTWLRSQKTGTTPRGAEAPQGSGARFYDEVEGP